MLLIIKVSWFKNEEHSISQNDSMISENIFYFQDAQRCHKLLLTTLSLVFLKSYGHRSSKATQFISGFWQNWNMTCQLQIKFWNVSHWKGDNRKKESNTCKPSPLDTWGFKPSNFARHIAIWPLGTVSGYMSTLIQSENTQHLVWVGLPGECWDWKMLEAITSLQIA